MAKASKNTKYVYTWGNKKADGDGSMKALLGGKGANLAEMSRIGLPGASRLHDHHRGLHLLLRQQADLSRRSSRRKPGSRHGFPRENHGHKVRLDKSAMPLLVSVRSGARDSMPGMMDTILNLGLNDPAVLALVKATQQRALRLGLLPPLRPNVWRRRHGRPEARKDEDHEPFEARHPQFQA